MRAPEEDVARGLAAERLLNEPMVIEAFELIEGNMKQAWLDSPEADFEGRERAYRMMRAARMFRETFELAVRDGKLAKIRVDHNLKEKADDRTKQRLPV